MMIVLVGGASGSGKTTLAQLLVKQLKHQGASLIAIDSYYRDRSHMPLEERNQLNFDHPEAIEHNLLIENLKQFRIGAPINIPIYDFRIHTRIGSSAPIEPTPFIVIEGIFALYWPELRELAQHRIFVETPLSLCLERRIERDQLQRGRTRESVIHQWNETVEPMYHEFVAQTKEHASICVQGDQEIEQTVELLIDTINS